MGAAAARVLFDGKPRIDDVPGRTPIGDDGVDGEVALAIEHAQETLPVFDGVGRCGKILRRQQRGVQSVTRRLANVQRFRHRAKIRLQAGGERRCQCQRLRGFLHRQAEQLRTGRGGAEHTDGGGRMPALLVMVEIDAAGDPGFRFPAGDIGGDEIAAVAAARFRQGKQRRQDRSRGVATQRVAAIVIIQRMGGGAVDRCRIHRTDPMRGPEYHAWAIGAADRGNPAGDTRTRLFGAGQNAADRVHDRDLGPMPRLVRQSVVGDAGNSGRQCFGDGHACASLPSTSDYRHPV